MIPYLWVAAGSALGGMARYGFGLFAARLWGQSFPWGTIAINVVGSFVISFFGTLTLADGLLPANANLRIFVMVGICGGFTTFSSFSLQTLELARGGAFLGATGNVLLSVLACLMAVTAGHVSAEKLNGVRREASTMPARIVAVLDRPETAHPVLAAAALAGRRLRNAQIEALHVRHDPMEGFMPTEEVMTEERRQEISGENARRSTDLRDIFDGWHAETRQGMWREVTGPTRQVVPAEAAHADFLVLARPDPHAGGDAREALHAALFDTRAATLLVPREMSHDLGRHVAIAWKSAAASSRAVEAAMPLLSSADRVSVLTETDDDGAEPEPPSVVKQLDGKQVTLHRFRASGRGIGQALLEEARHVGADLLVMGAYSRSRLSEFVLGGATREILAEADIPVLMRH
ncbi:MAG: fluoride efflux transporter CrcB [Proteobacteria bacterium]|nr:fluoride efflux transporter CrcB [Pseudomonadota bacterium]